MIETARQLTNRVEGLTEAVEGLREDFVKDRVAAERAQQKNAEGIAESRAAFRRATTAITIGLLAALLGAVVTFAAWANAAVVTCENGNLTRNSIEQRFDDYTVALGQVTHADPAVVEAVRAQFAASRPNPLQPRDCSWMQAIRPTRVGS